MSRDRSGPARQPSLREHNLSVVLGEVAAAGPVSRARIASATGLTKATVSTLVDALAAAGLVHELGPHPVSAGVGRPGSALALGEGPVGIGLEINVDYLATCTVDLAGTVRRRELVSEDFRTAAPDAVLARAAAALRSAVDDAAAAGSAIAGVTVAVPGLVEARAGLLRLAPNLGWRDVPVLDELAGRVGGDRLTGVPLRLDNEANLAAIGELRAGGHVVDGEPLSSFLHVSGEIGVGAALVLGGRLFGGTRGFAGEIGHLPVDAAGARCRCGSVGCLELVAGQEAILRRAGFEGAARTASGHPQGPVEEVIAAAGTGDRASLDALDEAGRALGVALSVAVNLVDVGTVLLGGLYARLAPWLRGAIESELAARVLSARWDPVRLLVGSLGAEAAVRGAALSAVRTVLEDPAAWIARSAARA